jgi:hypothetical protein
MLSAVRCGDAPGRMPTSSADEELKMRLAHGRRGRFVSPDTAFGNRARRMLEGGCGHARDR